MYRPFGPSYGRLTLSLSHGCATTFPSSALWTQGLTSLPIQHYCLFSPLDGYDAPKHTRLALPPTSEDNSTVSTSQTSTCAQFAATAYDASYDTNAKLFSYGSNGLLSTPSSSRDESFANRFHSVQTCVSPLSQFDQQQQYFLPTNSPPYKILTYEGYSSFQMNALFHSLSVHDALVSEHLLDWVLGLLTTSTRYGVFYFDNHWFPFSFRNQSLTLVLPHKFYLSSQPLLHNALAHLPPNVLQRIAFLQSPPTPTGLCGLTAALIIHHWAGHQHGTSMHFGDQGPPQDAWHLPGLSFDSETFSWTRLSALHQLHNIHICFSRYTRKLPYLAPIGHMEATSSSSNDNEPPHPFDFRTIQVDNHELFAHPLVDLPLSSPDLPQTPITISLYPTANDLAQQNDIESYLKQFFIYCHIAQTLQFQLFTVTPEQSFLNEWQKTFPGYDKHTIDVILVWNSLHSTWLRTDFAEIEDLTRKQQTGACHLRIVFHSRYVHVTFPLMKRIFSIEILPTFTITQISSQIALYLGDTTRRIMLSQLGRVLSNNFNLWTASPNFTAQILVSYEGNIVSSYHGRQTPGQVQFCTCHTWCDTTQTLTKRFFEQSTIPHLPMCFFRRPQTNYLYALTICSITTPAHVYTRFLPPHLVHWLPLVNNIIVSMDTPMMQYGRFVTLEFHELPSTFNVRTETLWGQSVFHLNIQEPNAISQRPLRRFYLYTMYPPHKPQVPILVEPYLLVCEFEEHLANFLRLNNDRLQTPYPQPDATFIKDSQANTYPIQCIDDPYLIQRNFYNHMYPQAAIRPYPPNHDHWLVTDQFSSFLLPVQKDFAYPQSFREIFLAALPVLPRDNFDFTYVQSVIFQDEQYCLDDNVPTHRAERITYLLRPVHLDIHLQETNTRLQYTVSPLTQVSHLKQLIEVYLHISKHHLIIPEAETEFVTALPYPLLSDFPT